MASSCHIWQVKKGTPWYWGKEQNQAFRRAKKHLIPAKVLTHFDPGKKLLLACDASPYGVAAILSHQMEDGSDRPIVFVSRTLTPAEKKYSQLEKEGLAVVFGVCKFNQYLMGRSFTILSDHKPLQYLFSAGPPSTGDGLDAHSTLGPHSECVSVRHRFQSYRATSMR